MNILEKWDYQDETVNEVVMISAIEHFTRTEAEFIVSEIKRVLVPEGQLIIDFPDIKKDVEIYHDKNPEFLMELIYCNHKNRLSTHNWGYTEKTFTKLLGSGWKEIIWTDIVKHDYPMLGALCIKK
jgi:cyclopropane fatty-acyl-phospholipid synthase-like methyltransferase